MKITPSHKLTQHVKHPATTWPNLILPLSSRGQRIWSTSVFFKCVSFPSYATSRDKEKRMKSHTCWTNGPRPNLSFLFFHATSWHKANSPDTTPYRSSTDFPIFPLRHLVAQSRSPRHTAQSVSDRFCLSYTTSWYILFLFSLFFFYTSSGHRAEVPDTLLKRSPTDLCFLFLSFSYTTP